VGNDQESDVKSPFATRRAALGMTAAMTAGLLAEKALSPDSAHAEGVTSVNGKTGVVKLPGLTEPEGELPSSVASGSAVTAGNNGLVWNSAAWVPETTIYQQNNEPQWYGKWLTIGNTLGSVGVKTPIEAPATTVGSGGVTLPLENGTVPITDCSKLNENGGSFTLGGYTIVYKGRSKTTGEGKATGSYTLSSASGTYVSGTALGFAGIGFGPLAIYQKFGDTTGATSEPIPGSTQAAFLHASYYGPTVDDSAEGFSAGVEIKEVTNPFAQNKPATGFEADAQIEGGNTMPGGYTAPLLASAARTRVLGAGTHVKTVIGSQTSHESSGGSFWDEYQALSQSGSALAVYGTLNGEVTLPATEIAVTGTFPSATAAHPVTVRVGCNAQGMGGASVTYTGQSGGKLTGCTGGTGKWATGSNIANFAYGVNVQDPILTASGFGVSLSGWGGAFTLAIKGTNDSVNSMFSLTGPSNAELTGGLTQMRLNAGNEQTKDVLQVYNSSGTHTFSVAAAGGINLFSEPLVLAQSGTNCVRIDASGYIQPGVSTVVGASATVFGVRIFSGPGVPEIEGTEGYLYIRTNGGVGSTIYRCTKTGKAKEATWTAIL
jgi:hypothetical protein